jgi:uncharacterized protein DUF2652
LGVGLEMTSFDGAEAMSQRGYLLIADITGYTMFLTQSELEHAHDILEAIFNSLLAELKEPLTLSNFQGDAILVHVPEEDVPQGQILLEGIERLYCSFADTLASMQSNTSCTCNACRNIHHLDLKFVVHHGTYLLHSLAGRQELEGPDVIRVHRLLKNDVRNATAIKAYVFVTEAAAAAMRLPEFFAGVRRHVEHSPNMGETKGYVYDLRPIWERHRATHRIRVAPDEPLAFEPLECDLPLPPPLAWAYVVDVGNRTRWQREGIDRIHMSGLNDGRVGPGSVQHCDHGRGTTLHRIVDWRPFDYVTYQVPLLLGARVRQTAEFAANADGGTHVSVRSAEPEAKGALRTALVRFMIRLRANKLTQQQRAWKLALQHVVSEDVQAGRVVRTVPSQVSTAEISAAAAAAIAE